MAKPKGDTEQYSEAETARRRDEAIRRALSTPPRPHKELAKKIAKQKPKSAEK